ncbi:hypothetical protein L1987_64981 [Smallanthus sonchifolius]|uniref:Uncharacterized protein n=1 Tax=Smallanthus sonchifolius TaxID=185202 RepID=A0ACB9BT43_9ASTR|nr:hypothetical protein L1987_64981 [Smallanthus sonchifolius]
MSVATTSSSVVTCLLTKATELDSILWHRNLEHISYESSCPKRFGTKDDVEINNDATKFSKYNCCGLHNFATDLQASQQHQTLDAADRQIISSFDFDADTSTATLTHLSEEGMLLVQMIKDKATTSEVSCKDSYEDF